MAVGPGRDLGDRADHLTSDDRRADARAVYSLRVRGDGLEFGMANGQMTQVAYTAILEHFVQTGRAPHYTELAGAVDVDIAEARELQRAAASAAPAESCWLAHDTDHIESWAPFSNVPTHYLISVDGIQKWYGQ